MLKLSSPAMAVLCKYSQQKSRIWPRIPGQPTKANARNNPIKFNFCAFKKLTLLKVSIYIVYLAYSWLIFPWKSWGTMLIFKSGGNGNPRNLVVAPVSGGIYSVLSSKLTESSLPSVSFVPVPVPVPPSALYSKSGYLEIPSLQASRVLKLTL